MRIDSSPTRRALMLGAAQAFSAAVLAKAVAATETLPKMTVTRDPTCGGCGNWVEHIKAAGFAVDVIQVDDVLPLKARLGVPQALMSCHTAEIGVMSLRGMSRPRP